MWHVTCCVSEQRRNFLPCAKNSYFWLFPVVVTCSLFSLWHSDPWHLEIIQLSNRNKNKITFIRGDGCMICITLITKKNFNDNFALFILSWLWHWVSKICCPILQVAFWGPIKGYFEDWDQVQNCFGVYSYTATSIFNDSFLPF